MKYLKYVILQKEFNCYAIKDFKTRLLRYSGQLKKKKKESSKRYSKKHKNEVKNSSNKKKNNINIIFIIIFYMIKYYFHYYYYFIVKRPKYAVVDVLVRFILGWIPRQNLQYAATRARAACLGVKDIFVNEVSLSFHVKQFFFFLMNARETIWDAYGPCAFLFARIK